MNCAKQMRTRTTQGFVEWRIMRLLRISGLVSPLRRSSRSRAMRNLDWNEMETHRFPSPSGRAGPSG